MLELNSNSNNNNNNNNKEMSQRIQFLRNSTVATDKATAKTKLITAINNRQNAGEPIVGMYNYTEDETKKTGVLLAVAVGDGKNYSIFEPGNEASDGTTAAIEKAIQALDVDAIGGEKKLITTVSETDGKISAISIDNTAANIPSVVVKSGDDTIGITSSSVQAALEELAKAIKSTQTQAETTIRELDVTDTAVNDNYVSTVSQTNGKISVSKAKLPVTTVNDTKIDNQFVTNIKLNNTIVEAERSGITASQVTRSGGTNVKSTTVEGAIEEVGKAVVEATTAGKVTISTTTTTEGYLKSYTIYQGGTDDNNSKIGTIDIPKDLVVTSGSVVYGTWSADNNFTENGESGTGTDTALKLVIANQTDPVYINTKSLVDIYTAGIAITVDANKISVKLADTQDGNAALDSTNGLKVAAVKTSSSYGNSVTYPTVSGVNFTPVAKDQTLDAALRNVDGNVATLANQVVANEKVTAEALTSLKNAAGFDDNGNYSAVTDATYIANAISVKDATSKLDAAIKAVADAEVDVAAGNAISVTTVEGSKTKTIAVKYDTNSLALSTDNELYVSEIDGGTY